MGEVRTAIRVVDKSSSALNKINARLQAMQKQMESIAKSSQATNDALQKVASANDKLASVLNKTTSASTRAAAGHNRNKAALDGYNNSTKRGITYTDQLIGKLRRLASTYLGVMGAQAAITAGDAITRTENQLGTIYDQQQAAAGLPLSSGADDQRLIAFQENSLQKIFNSAQKVRTGFTDMAQNVSKSMVLAGDAFENNIDNAIRFQEIMGEAYAVGGASAAEQASSMYQMVQALGSGILQGDELRSVREGAAMAYNEIEKFAQGVYDTTDSLKDMASEGMITSDLVVAAILNAALVNSVNPYRIEGQKSSAFEICDVLGAAPDYLCIPVGNAGNITAYWKGFKEYFDNGVVSNKPKMFGFEAEGAAAIVKNQRIMKPETIATAIRIGNPASWDKAVAARDESKGIIDMVSDPEIIEAYKLIASCEGILAEPASAASVAGLIKSHKAGLIEEGSTIACVLTGNGLKDPDSAIKYSCADVKKTSADIKEIAKKLNI